jgi:hypothetical protein
LLILPFVVGFDFPDSTGTYAKVSAGGGHYRFTPSCSRYTYGNEFQEAEFSVQHRFATQPADPDASVWKKIKPGHVTLTAIGDAIREDIEVIALDTVASDGDGTWRPASGEPTLGSRNTAIGYAAGAKVGLDWKWLGMELGASANSYRKRQGEEGEDGGLPPIMPILGLRLGDADRVYASLEVMEASPIVSNALAIMRFPSELRIDCPGTAEHRAFSPPCAATLFFFVRQKPKRSFNLNPLKRPFSRA